MFSQLLALFFFSFFSLKMGPGHSLTQGSNFLTSCKNVGRNFFLTTFGNYLVSNAWHTHTNTQHLLPSICRIYTYIVHTCQVKSGLASTAAAACQQLVSNCFASLLLSLTVFCQSGSVKTFENIFTKTFCRGGGRAAQRWCC